MDQRRPSATLQSLGAARTGGREPPARQHPLLPALRERVGTLLGERLQRMLDGADQFLFDLSQKAGANEQQRLYFDTMRAVRLERVRIAQYFRQELGQAFSESDQAAESNATDDVDFSRLQLQDAEELDQSIALKNMSAAAETAYAEPLWELDLRLRWIEKHLIGVELPRRALTPSGFCEAFRVAVQPLDVAPDVKLVIYKLFDRLVLGDLSAVYEEVLAVMTQHGVQADKAGPRPAAPRPAARTPPAVDPATLAALQGRGGLPGLIDAAAAQAMRSAVGAAASGGDYSDAMLAAELLGAACGHDLDGLGPEQAWATTQRAGLVGRMFNQILEDARVPPALSGALEALRFPVIKAALADGSFFERADHPVRTLVHDLAGLAAAAQDGGDAAMEPLAQLLGKVREQFDPPAGAVRPALRTTGALPEPEVERFLGEQAEHGKTRRQMIVERTRRAVAQELQWRTREQPLAAEVQPLLRSGWAPMMAMRLLRHGAHSPDWNEGVNLLQRVLEAIDPRRAPPEGRAALRDDLARALSTAGLPAQRVQDLLLGLDRAIEKLPSQSVPEEQRGAANEPAAPRPEHVLDLLLVPGAWFRVFDRGLRDTRWLKLVAHHPERQSIVLAEFDGRHPLSLHPRELIVDLAARRTEPIDPTPAARAALEALRQGTAHAA